MYQCCQQREIKVLVSADISEAWNIVPLRTEADTTLQASKNCWHPIFSVLTLLPDYFFDNTVIQGFIWGLTFVASGGCAHATFRESGARLFLQSVNVAKYTQVNFWKYSGLYFQTCALNTAVGFGHRAKSLSVVELNQAVDLDKAA